LLKYSVIIVTQRMSSNDSTVNLDDSSVLSSTKNSSVLEASNVIDIASSDEEDVGNSISENVDSASENLDNRNVEICSSDEEVSENYLTSAQSPFQVTLKPDINLNTSSDQSSVVSASQLLSANTSSYFNSNATLPTDNSTVAELTAELSNHKMKLSEDVVEGFGNKVEEIGEIIEDTFKDKKIASTFGDNESENEVEEVTSACMKLSLDEENVIVEGIVEQSSPHKRKVDLAEKHNQRDLSSGEVTDVEDNLNTVDTAGLPAKRQKIGELDLPKTCQVLVSENSGAKVYLIGTAHFSKESCEDVSLVIQGVQPDIVMVELCKARTNILHLDEETILEEAQNLNFEKSLEIIRTQGTVQGVMYLLLLSMSAHLTKELGMAPGGEFRRAFTEAKKVPGCMVHLGDRPINITLKRALAALSPWQKLRLGWNILTSRDSITKEEVEKCKDRDLLENMLAEMAGEFPALSHVFVAERDIFLAHSLQMAADAIPVNALGPDGNKLENFKPPTVVGVVGIGHVPGIIEKWGKVTREDVREVVKVYPPSAVTRLVKFSVKTVFWGGCLYGVYRLCRGPVSRLLIVR